MKNFDSQLFVRKKEKILSSGRRVVLNRPGFGYYFRFRAAIFKNCLAELGKEIFDYSAYREVLYFLQFFVDIEKKPFWKKKRLLTRDEINEIICAALDFNCIHFEREKTDDDFSDGFVQVPFEHLSAAEWKMKSAALDSELSRFTWFFMKAGISQEYAWENITYPQAQLYWKSNNEERLRFILDVNAAQNGNKSHINNLKRDL